MKTAVAEPILDLKVPDLTEEDQRKILQQILVNQNISKEAIALSLGWESSHADDVFKYLIESSLIAPNGLVGFSLTEEGIDLLWELNEIAQDSAPTSRTESALPLPGTIENGSLELIKKLEVHPKNLEIYGDENRDWLKDSIRNSQEIITIVVSIETGYIIDGNSRFQVLIELIAEEGEHWVNRFKILWRSFGSVDEEVEALIHANNYRTKTDWQRLQEGKNLAEIEARKAELRKKQGVKETLPGGHGQTRDKVGQAIGISGKTYEVGVKVLGAVEGFKKSDKPSDRARADKLEQQLKGQGTINSAAKLLKRFEENPNASCFNCSKRYSDELGVLRCGAHNFELSLESTNDKGSLGCSDWVEGEEDKIAIFDPTLVKYKAAIGKVKALANCLGNAEAAIAEINSIAEASAIERCKDIEAVMQKAAVAESTDTEKKRLLKMVLEVAIAAEQIEQIQEKYNAAFKKFETAHDRLYVETGSSTPYLREILAELEGL